MSEPIKQIIDDLVAVALQFGLSRQLASDFARAAVDRMTKNIGGGSLYIPKEDKESRDAKIRARFNGVNHDELCRVFGVSKRTLYRIIK